MIQLATHLRHNRYGSFTLTDAIRLGADVPISPQQGYRIERFRDPVSRRRLPMLAASVSAEQIFEVFLDLLQPLGETVEVVLETSHNSGMTTIWIFAATSSTSRYLPVIFAITKICSSTTAAWELPFFAGSADQGAAR